VLCGRSQAQPSDLWVLRYVWDREEQVAPLAALVAGVIEPHAGETNAHPLAAPAERVDAEGLARRLDALAGEVEARTLSLSAAARAREGLADLVDRAAWLPDEPARRFLVDRARELLRRLG
jgi:MoxR-like ATPase